jgi:hypothetical protein
MFSEPLEGSCTCISLIENEPSNSMISLNSSSEGPYIGM